MSANPERGVMTERPDAAIRSALAFRPLGTRPPHRASSPLRGDAGAPGLASGRRRCTSARSGQLSMASPGRTPASIVAVRRLKQRAPHDHRVGQRAAPSTHRHRSVPDERSSRGGGRRRDRRMTVASLTVTTSRRAPLTSPHWHGSPMPSGGDATPTPPRSSWNAFAMAAQLSHASPIPSPSKSSL
ncbi:MAG: hypothetical protein MZV70_45445 [Desulfobacterales bacterium]|nr:hypothetical protein [Desulfobacterales bacterium]